MEYFFIENLFLQGISESNTAGQQEESDYDDKNSFDENDIDIFMLRHSFEQEETSELPDDYMKKR